MYNLTATGEICSEQCGAIATSFHWVDAKQFGVEASHSDVKNLDTEGAQNLDDGFFEVTMPFDFPFFGQRKTQEVRISTNGYLSFSGEIFGYGNTWPIPHRHAPNDMIAPYWTDLDMSAGSVYTYTIDPSDDSADAQYGAGNHPTSCQHGIAAGAGVGSANSVIGEGERIHQACCAASCGSCGGSGCGSRPGGADSCCTQAITMKAPSCDETGGVGPCNIVEKAFVIEWEVSNSAYCLVC